MSVLNFFGGLLKGDGMVRLLYGIDLIAPCLQRLHRIHRLSKCLPRHRLLCAEGSLMQVVVGAQRVGLRRDATQIQAFQQEGIGCAEDSTHVMLAADIVKHHHQRQFLCLAKCLRRQTIHLLYG